MLRKVLKNRRGEGYIDTVIMVLCAMLMIAMAVKIFPAYMAKQKIDIFATEILREAIIAGQVGSETSAEEQKAQRRIRH